MSGMVDGCSKYWLVRIERNALSVQGFSSAEEGVLFLGRNSNSIDTGKYDFEKQYERTREIARALLAHADECEQRDKGIDEGDENEALQD